jgi:hypothetical protein
MRNFPENGLSDICGARHVKIQEIYAASICCYTVTMDEAKPYERANQLATDALNEALAEGISAEQILIVVADILSTLAWKLGGEAGVREIVTRIEAATEVCKGTRLPLQSEQKN